MPSFRPSVTLVASRFAAAAVLLAPSAGYAAAVPAAPLLIYDLTFNQAPVDAMPADQSASTPVPAAAESAAIDADALAARLDTAGLPPLDLLVRTSGETRLSNFLLWQAAYAELLFVETLWPDFDEAELARAVEQFGQRQRRYGGL